STFGPGSEATRGDVAAGPHAAVHETHAAAADKGACPRRTPVGVAEQHLHTSGVDAELTSGHITACRGQALADLDRAGADLDVAVVHHPDPARIDSGHFAQPADPVLCPARAGVLVEEGQPHPDHPAPGSPLGLPPADLAVAGGVLQPVQQRTVVA